MTRTIDALEQGLRDRGLEVPEDPWWRDTRDRDPATDVNAALRRACMVMDHSNLAEIKDLLKAGANPDDASEDGLTAVMATAWAWRPDALMLFLERQGSIDVNVRDY